MIHSIQNLTVWGSVLTTRLAGTSDELGAILPPDVVTNYPWPVGFNVDLVFPVGA